MNISKEAIPAYTKSKILDMTTISHYAEAKDVLLNSKTGLRYAALAAALSVGGKFLLPLYGRVLDDYLIRKQDKNFFIKATGSAALDLAVGGISGLLWMGGNMAEAASVKLAYNLMESALPDIMSSVKSRKSHVRPL